MDTSMMAFIHIPLSKFSQLFRFHAQRWHIFELSLHCTSLSRSPSVFQALSLNRKHSVKRPPLTSITKEPVAPSSIPGNGQNSTTLSIPQATNVSQSGNSSASSGVTSQSQAFAIVSTTVSGTSYDLTYVPVRATGSTRFCRSEDKINNHTCCCRR